jgi:type I restriction enzyme S subunit
MRDGWVNRILGELAEITTGSRAKGGAITSGIPSIGGEQIAEDRSIKFNKMKFIPKDHFESMRTGKLKFGDSLLVKDGATTGKVGYWGYDISAAVNEHVFILRAKPDCAEPYFINLLISHRPFREEIESRTRGIIGGITRDIENIELVVPSLPEQKRIVDLISSVDSYIEALQQQLESAKRSRNAVLHELLQAGGDDWVETTLGEITDLVRGPFGGSLKKDIFVQEGFAVYEQQHAIYGDFSTIRYRISSEKFNEMKRFSLLPGDLIMSCSGTMGKVRIVPKEAEPGIINQALLKIKPKSDLTSDFLYLWMQSDDFIRQIEMNSGGGALQNVSSVKMLKGIKLIIPDLVEQERIIEIISTLDEVKIKTGLAIDGAKSLRSGLLSDLLSGEHEIPASYDKVMGAA